MLKPKPQPLALIWDQKSGRYRDARSGKYVSRNAVLDVRDRIVADAERRLVKLSEDYRDNKITLAEWQTEFRDVIRAGHTLAAGIAMGGKANVTPKEWLAVGRALKIQYSALNGFALDLESGRAMNLGRVRQYARAIRATMLNAERLRLPATKMAQWVRTRAESCSGCVYQALRGIQPLATFPPLHSQDCRQNCRCFLRYLTGSEALSLGNSGQITVAR